MKTFLR